MSENIVVNFKQQKEILPLKVAISPIIQRPFSKNEEQIVQLMSQEAQIQLKVDIKNFDDQNHTKSNQGQNISQNQEGVLQDTQMIPTTCNQQSKSQIEQKDRNNSGFNYQPKPLICVRYDIRYWEKLKNWIYLNQYCTSYTYLIFFNGYAQASEFLQHLQVNQHNLSIKYNDQDINLIDNSDQNKKLLGDTAIFLSNQNIIYCIKYNEINYHEELRWLYQGIFLQFKQQYSAIINLKNLFDKNLFSQCFGFLQQNQQYCGVTPLLQHSFEYSSFPIKFKDCFTHLLNNYMEHDESLFDFNHFSFNHDLTFCFYNFNNFQFFIEPLISKLSNWKTDSHINALMQTNNCILPILTLIEKNQKKLKFQNLQISSSSQLTTSIEYQNLEETHQLTRRIGCRNWFFPDYLWNNLNSPKTDLIVFCQFFKIINQKISVFFGISGFAYIIFYSSYDLAQSLMNVESNFWTLIGMLLPYLSFLLLVHSFLYNLIMSKLINLDASLMVFETLMNFYLILVVIGELSYNYLYPFFSHLDKVSDRIAEQDDLLQTQIIVFSVFAFLGTKLLYGILTYKLKAFQYFYGKLINYLFHFQLITVKYDIYCITQLNSTYDNSKLGCNQYYVIVDECFQWFIANFFVCLIFFIIEHVFEYKGYIFMFLICYYAFNSLSQLINRIILKIKPILIYNNQFDLAKYSPQIEIDWNDYLVQQLVPQQEARENEILKLENELKDTLWNITTKIEKNENQNQNQHENQNQNQNDIQNQHENQNQNIFVSQNYRSVIENHAQKSSQYQRQFNPSNTENRSFQTKIIRKNQISPLPQHIDQRQNEKLVENMQLGN